ncbi:MAG: hypothetical protein Ct9H300mP11_31120 [Chloroflexota bacterium]|nr:MAG: hypothetical protein Ct9H300mP11_31120 [Chloroflexota bacterium]
MASNRAKVMGLRAFCARSGVISWRLLLLSLAIWILLRGWIPGKTVQLLVKLWVGWISPVGATCFGTSLYEESETPVKLLETVKLITRFGYSTV